MQRTCVPGPMRLNLPSSVTSPIFGMCAWSTIGLSNADCSMWDYVRPRASVQGKALRILHRESSGETMKVLRFNACCSMLFERSKRNRSKFPGSRPKSLRVCFQAFAAFFALAHRSLCALAIAKRPALEMRRRFFGSVRTSRCFFPEPFKTSMAELMDPSCFCSFDASAFNARTMFTE